MLMVCCFLLLALCWRCVGVSLDVVGLIVGVMLALCWLYGGFMLMLRLGVWLCSVVFSLLPAWF